MLGSKRYKLRPDNIFGIVRLQENLNDYIFAIDGVRFTLVLQIVSGGRSAYSISEIYDDGINTRQTMICVDLIQSRYSIKLRIPLLKTIWIMAGTIPTTKPGGIG